MAGEIRLQATSGLAVKALIVGVDGKVWNGAAMAAVVSLTDAEWTSSLIACTAQETSEAASTGLYLADWPGLTQSAVYAVVFYSGAAPAPGDQHIGTQNDPTEYADAMRQVISSDLPMKVTKNVELANFTFLMVDDDHYSPSTGLSITATRSIDGANFAPCANSATEVELGIYKITLADSDLNGDTITLRFAASGADTRYVTIVTQTT